MGDRERSHKTAYGNSSEVSVDKIKAPKVSGLFH